MRVRQFRLEAPTLQPFLFSLEIGERNLECDARDSWGFVRGRIRYLSVTAEAQSNLEERRVRREVTPGLHSIGIPF